jgi:tetratricopeptide (TPR) repeat protein
MLAISALCCILSLSSPDVHLTLEQQIAVLEEAQHAYDRAIRLQTADPVASKESFRRASNRYQILVDDGIKNGKLWYDLGNAQLQSGEIGEAIAAYRSAQRFIPSNGRLVTNLEYARSLVTNPMLLEGSTSILKRLAFWHDTVPTELRLIVGIVFWIGCWTLVATRFFILIPGFKTVTITLGLATLALGVSVGADFANQHQRHGVLTAKEVIVRKGNSLQDAPMFQDPIQEGIEFDILGVRSGWLHIRLQNGGEGWIQQDDAQVVAIDDFVSLG